MSVNDGSVAKIETFLGGQLAGLRPGFAKRNLKSDSPRHSGPRPINHLNNALVTEKLSIGPVAFFAIQRVLDHRVSLRRQGGSVTW